MQSRAKSGSYGITGGPTDRQRQVPDRRSICGRDIEMLQVVDYLVAKELASKTAGSQPLPEAVQAHSPRAQNLRKSS